MQSVLLVFAAIQRSINRLPVVCSFHQINKYLLIAYCIQETVLGIGDIVINKTVMEEGVYMC